MSKAEKPRSSEAGAPEDLGGRLPFYYTPCRLDRGKAILRQSLTYSAFDLFYSKSKALVISSGVPARMAKMMKLSFMATVE